MSYDIILSPQAKSDLKSLTARTRTEVRERIDVHLRHEPTKTSKSRIKRLAGVTKPQYRLRVGEIRVFYDVVGMEVQVLAIVTKSKAEEWLRAIGESK